jgi:hypothetical protein
MGSPSLEVNVTLTVWLAPTVTDRALTEAVAVTESSDPVGASPTGPAFGGVVGVVGVVPLLVGGAMVPLSVPTEVEPQAHSSGSDATPRRIKR